ncbi:RagB/SusD family nutrient uptake outer membrane protein [Sphingobacterium sp. SGG-5]|uniref:RagB/SusD family nutrient uptake outer membrane protein n=1 Tax=Sphingobacterium sp. SGG-5 TaxID=2710881 RepID=UPI0013EB59CA|nr:RagB/SusD family nutrient uptake outer membrane protein [Sphingobacterium sp. SGG-5]NGM60640.1 RagB/SusD family nutrient uptake outer membrane protein [Sphingobacterium sp. SGG-5]
MKRLIFILTILFLYSCDIDKYLDKAESGGMTLDEVFGDYGQAERFLSNIYSRLPVDYANKYTNASDDSESPHGTAGENQINNGVFSPASNPFNNWTATYTAIRTTNIFLQNADRIPTLDANQLAGKPRMIGEATFLRAYFYAELFRRWGGVPILLEPLDINEDMKIPRNTAEQVVEFIVDECDKAAGLLELEYPAIHLGRATKGAALALKSRVLLHYASQLHNPTNDVGRWQDAVDAAKDVMDLNFYELHPDYKGLFHTRNSKEIIFQNTANYTDFTLQTFVPSQGGQVGITPLQNIVDMYEMRNGELPFIEDNPGLAPTINPASGYNPTNPYVDRDPRFYMSILFNGSTWRTQPIFTYQGAPENGIGGGFNNTTTGYYLAKMVDQNSSRTPTIQNGTYYWIYFRYAEILLNYAEALNEALITPSSEVYGAINAIRSRSGVNMPDLPSGLSKEQMRKRIRNERRIELAFEGQRFFDVKRWRIGAQVTPNAYGTRATNNGDGTYTYTRFLVENRVYPSYFDLFPIMQTELNRNTVLEQNPGYIK